MTYLTILSLFIFSPKLMEKIIYKPSKINFNHWEVVNDNVMGGISKSEAKLKDSLLDFSGIVSTKNNGGFASIKNKKIEIDTKDYSCIKLYLKGDGKKYQFRIKDNSDNFYSYINYFQTSGKWEEITLLLSDFKPSFRGQFLNTPNFNKSSIKEISFLIANKIEESFNLKIKQISIL